MSNSETRTVRNCKCIEFKDFYVICDKFYDHIGSEVDSLIEVSVHEGILKG